MSKYVNLTQDDIIRDTTKVTTGLFSGGVGTLAANILTTASLATSQDEYYYNLQHSSADQFSVSYGHINGSGSSDVIGQSKAVYKQFSAQLLLPDDIDAGFKFHSTTVGDDDIYGIVFERARMLDRVNKKNWTINLSGSDAAGAGTTLSLTDDSDSVASVSTPVGPRYNIVAGALGVVTTPATTLNYGYFYPNVGTMILSAAHLSASIPGIHAASSSIGNGFTSNLATDGTADNAYKMADAIINGSNTLRNEEDQAVTSYFCRAKAGDFNFSNNPTYTSGSDSQMLQRTFESNPQTFITTVGLYNNNKELVAVGRLSTPIQKNHKTEAVFKLNLTH